MEHLRRIGKRNWYAKIPNETGDFEVSFFMLHFVAMAKVGIPIWCVWAVCWIAIALIVLVVLALCTWPDDARFCSIHRRQYWAEWIPRNGCHGCGTANKQTTRSWEVRKQCFPFWCKRLRTFTQRIFFELSLNWLLCVFLCFFPSYQWMKIVSMNQIHTHKNEAIMVATNTF